MIPRQRVEFTVGDLLKALRLTLRPTVVVEFREILRTYFGAQAVVLTPSGRAGIYLLLKALPYRKVILPAYTCRVVVQAALLAAKQVVYVDIDLATFNMRPSEIETVADEDSIILATHQFGIPCDIATILDIARNNGAFVIEDAAGALGTTVAGKKVGTFAPLAIVSFEKTKTVTCMEGGAIIINDPKWTGILCKLYESETMGAYPFDDLTIGAVSFGHLVIGNPLIYPVVRAAFIALYGPTAADDRRFRVEKNRTYTRRFSALQAALGLKQMNNINQTVLKRQAIAQQYQEEIRDIPHINLPVWPTTATPCLIRFPIKIVKGQKESFYQHCVTHGFDLAWSFNYSCAPVQDLHRFPNSFIAARQVLDLPMYSRLSQRDLRQIVDGVRKFRW